MKVVIDIPPQMWALVREGHIPVRAYECIVKGTPLPKGHGRLIDADALIKQLEEIANDEWNKHVGASKGLEDATDIVDDAPTIIEADEESEE